MKTPNTSTTLQTKGNNKIPSGPFTKAMVQRQIFIDLAKEGTSHFEAIFKENH
jgi:hypothetical protein